MQTQYGNILRIRPDDEKSPLLQPANEHKQLIVIDFEYAGANVPGLEFANHFSEWTYNYHDPVAPFACNTAVYPSLDQQHRFIKAYVDHRPQFHYSGASTPNLTPLATPPISMSSGSGTPALPSMQSTASTSSIVEFMLDARVPPGGWREEEARLEEEDDGRMKELLEETRLWRAANSAQWVAWGVVQAKVPGLKVSTEDEKPSTDSHIEDEQAEAAEEFDYLGYAQDRALFFWGDCVQMGLVKLEELPADLRDRIKVVLY
jgi:choline kinase